MLVRVLIDALSNCSMSSCKKPTMKYVLFGVFVVSGEQSHNVTGVVCSELPLYDFLRGNQGRKLFL
jgi:hypothetical protein